MFDPKTLDSCARIRLKCCEIFMMTKGWTLIFASFSSATSRCPISTKLQVYNFSFFERSKRTVLFEYGITPSRKYMGIPVRRRAEKISRWFFWRRDWLKIKILTLKINTIITLVQNSINWNWQGTIIRRFSKDYMFVSFDPTRMWHTVIYRGTVSYSETWARAFKDIHMHHFICEKCSSYNKMRP